MSKYLLRWDQATIQCNENRSVLSSPPPEEMPVLLCEALLHHEHIPGQLHVQREVVLATAFEFVDRASQSVLSWCGGDWRSPSHPTYRRQDRIGAVNLLKTQLDGLYLNLALTPTSASFPLDHGAFSTPVNPKGTKQTRGCHITKDSACQGGGRREAPLWPSCVGEAVVLTKPQGCLGPGGPIFPARPADLKMMRTRPSISIILKCFALRSLLFSQTTGSPEAGTCHVFVQRLYSGLYTRKIVNSG